MLNKLLDKYEQHKVEAQYHKELSKAIDQADLQLNRKQLERRLSSVIIFLTIVNAIFFYIALTTMYPVMFIFVGLTFGFLLAQLKRYIDLE